MAYLPILYRIQEIDNRLQNLKKVKEQITANPNLMSLEVLRKQLHDFLGKNEAGQKKNNTIQKQLELDLKTCLEHIKQEEAKLYNGSVTSSKGLEQIQQKVAEYQRLKDSIEDQILGLLDESEKLTADEADFKRRLDLCKQEISGIQAEIKLKAAEVTIEEHELEPELAELIPQIPPEWYSRYQKIAKAHFGVGITKVKADNCGACHVNLSDHMLQQVKRGEDALVCCENCGRILYY